MCKIVCGCNPRYTFSKDKEKSSEVKEGKTNTEGDKWIPKKRPVEDVESDGTEEMEAMELPIPKKPKISLQSSKVLEGVRAFLSGIKDASEITQMIQNMGGR